MSHNQRNDEGDEREALDPVERAEAEALAAALARPAVDLDRDPSRGHADALATYGRRAAAVLRAEDAGVGSWERGESMLAGVRARLANERPQPQGAKSAARPTLLQVVARSPLLRLVAASLMAHLLALPVLAWFTFRPSPQPQLNLRIEPAADPAKDFAPEPEVLEPRHAPWEWEQRRRLERFALTRANRGGALEVLRPSEQERADALAAGDWRAALVGRIDLWLGTGATSERSAATATSALAADGESAALWLGLAVDRALLQRDEVALAIVEAELAQLAARPNPGPLAAGLIARARALGLHGDGWPPPDQIPFDPAALLEQVLGAWPAAEFGPLARWSAAR